MPTLTKRLASPNGSRPDQTISHLPGWREEREKLWDFHAGFSSLLKIIKESAAARVDKWLVMYGSARRLIISLLTSGVSVSGSGKDSQWERTRRGRLLYHELRLLAVIYCNYWISRVKIREITKLISCQIQRDEMLLIAPSHLHLSLFWFKLITWKILVFLTLLPN